MYPDGTTVYADGTTVYPDGTTVYPEGSTEPVPEEEPVLVEEPEPVIPDEVPETPAETPEETPAEPTTEETQPATDPATDVETEEITEPVTEGEETETQEAGAPEEDEENKTEETSEESAEKTTEETAEGTTEKTTEETTEQTEEKTAEETADAAPAEELPLRTLTVSADQMAFRDQFLNPKEPVLWSGSVWNALYGTAIEPVYTDGHVTVEISGHLPETVTARAMFVEFADPGAAQNDERALMLLDVALLDETGAFYVPAEALHVSVSDASISGAVANGEPFAAYFDDAYDGLGDAGDVRVGLDDNIDGDRLAYIPGLRDTLLFWEAGDRLVSTENGTVDFDTNRFPFRFVLSAQQEPREEAQPEVLPEEQDQDEQPAEQQNAVKDVTLSGTLVASDGYTYEVSVSYPADCGLPVGAELSVEELIVGTDAYWDYINQSAAELGRTFGHWLAADQAGEQRGQYAASVALAIAGVLCSVAPYFAVAGIVRAMMAGQKDMTYYMQRCLLMAVLWLGRVLCHALSTSTSHRATFAVLAEIRKRGMEKLTRMPLGDVLAESTGALKNTLIERIDAIETTLAHIVPEFTANLLVPLIIIIYIFTIDWRMGLASLLTVPLGLACYVGADDRQCGFYERTVKATKALNATAGEYINGIQVIKVFGRQNRVMNALRLTQRGSGQFP